MPERDSTQGGQWKQMADEELWAAIQRGGRLAHVGIRKPGRTRGFYRARLLLDAADWRGGVQALAARPGVEVLLSDTTVAMVRVRLRDAAELAAVRRLPFIDYVEPVLIPARAKGQPMVAEFGCSPDPWSATYPFIGAYNPSGDVMSNWFTADYMGINNAWNRSNGSGQTIGVIDTGIDPGQPQLNAEFADGAPGRWYRYMDWTGNTSVSAWADRCSHGTRAAAVAVAPRDGKNMVGVAWGANLVAVRQEDNVVLEPTETSGDGNDSYQLGEAIEVAAYRNGARIISMALGAPSSFAYVSDKIDRWYYYPDASKQVLFVGAAGTTFCGDPAQSVVVFPASKPEVMAVTGVDPNGFVPCNTHYGSKVELAGHVYVPAAGAVALTGQDLSQFEGSSTATSTISGIAALVWSRFPADSRDAVRARLQSGGKAYPNRGDKIGYGVINAQKALGGMWNVSLSGCEKTDCSFTYKIATCQTYTYSLSYTGGDGPYLYKWDNGSTARSVTRTWCASPGEVSRYSVSGQVTDQSDGTTIWRNVSIEVIPANPDDACPTCPK